MRTAVLAVLAVTAIALILQAAGPAAYLRGDSAFFLRDANTFADGELARSRYSPGYALFLSPVAALLGDDLTAFGRASLVVTAVVAVAALWLVHRVLRRWLPPWSAVAALALLSLGQGVVVYFSEIRSEPLTLLLVAAGLLALLNGEDRWAPALFAGAVLTRVAMAPLVVVLWAMWFRRSRRAAVTGVVLCLLGVVAHFATGPTVDEGYVQIGGAVLDEGGGGGSLAALAQRASEGVEAYGRYGFPRLAWPYALLRSPVGMLAAAIALATMALGAHALLRDRHALGDREHATLVATFAGTVAYTALLVAWPIRNLAAIRLVIPGALAPLAALAAGATVLARTLLRRHDPRTVHAAAGALLALTVIGASASLVSVRERRDEGQGLLDYVEAHRTALPPGPIMSGKPGVSELVTGRTAYEFPVAADDIDAVAASTGTCLFALDPTDRSAAANRQRVTRQDFRVVASAGHTEIIVITSGWC